MGVYICSTTYPGLIVLTAVNATLIMLYNFNYGGHDVLYGLPLLIHRMEFEYLTIFNH